MPGATEGTDIKSTEETEMMTHDFEILQELFLPLLEEITAYSGGPGDDILRGELFWAELSDALGSRGYEVRDVLAVYKIADIEQYAGRFDNLRWEYIAWLAQYYCAGNMCPAITRLLGNADATFMEEVAFQKDLLTAITQAGRATIKDELKLADEFADADISDEEVSSAFHALERDATRNELRKQLQQWEQEELTVTKPHKRKRIISIPFIFLRFAAAAALGTVATIGVVTVYNSNNKQEAQVVNYNGGRDANKLQSSLAATDTARKTDSILQDMGARANDSVKQSTASLYIVLKGNVVDTATSEPVTDVAITMLDDKGKKKTVFSKNGKFQFRLPLHHDFVITGKKDGYHSATFSLSTRDAQKGDAGEVIDMVLRFSKER